MPVKQSVCLPILPKMDQTELLKGIADIGYPAIEIWGRDDGFDAFCDAATRHKLRVVSMIGHQALGDGLNKPENHDRIEAELRTSIDIAVAKDVPGLICFSGNRVEGMDEERAIANTADGLKRVASYAEEKGITLNLELLNSKVNHPGYQCDHTTWGLDVINRVGSPSVKLLYDIYHMQIMEGDIIRTIETHAEAFGHVHTAGNPGRNDLDDEQELNYRPICRALDRAGYPGYVGHEFKPKGEVLPALRHAYEICDV
jgi:hydroxypyruvate isomerase